LIQFTETNGNNKKGVGILIKADIIAHNYQHDHTIIAAESLRLGCNKIYESLFDTRQTICTRQSILDKDNNPQTISQLHHHLFGHPIPNNAHQKAKACADCFFKVNQSEDNSLVVLF